jgi:oligopeptide/dipeptide ABC transporter ATP-binding protein
MPEPSPVSAPGARAASADVVLELRDVRKHFPIRNAFGRRTGWLRAVDGVSLAVPRNAILSVVGESGCGKSTLAKTINGVYRLTQGQIYLNGREVGGLPEGQWRRLRKDVQYVYQDPGASLDPRWKVGRSLHEPLIIHTDRPARERDEIVREILDDVGLKLEHLDAYPHELSGGQQRRVALARALTLRPELLILDEPTSGLDVSVQATILKLLLALRTRFALTYLFISHDLGVVRMVSDAVAVMYLGALVEVGPTAAVLGQPRHPYTQSLLAALPEPGRRRLSDVFRLEGEPPDPARLPTGCRFRTRCPLAIARCATEEPTLRDLAPRQPTLQEPTLQEPTLREPTPHEPPLQEPGPHQVAEHAQTPAHAVACHVA